MKILITVMGSNGDLTPFISIALRLKELGHEVLFAIPFDLEHQIKDYPFEYKCYMQMAPDDKEDYHEFINQVLRNNQEKSLDYFDEVNKMCDGVSLILRNPHSPLGLLLAEYNNIPCVDIFLSPIYFSMDNMLKHYFNELFLDRTNALRKDKGLSETENVPFNVFMQDNLKIAGYPEFYVQGLRNNAELDYIFSHPNIRYSNFPPLFHDLELSQDVLDFINSGEPPVVFDMGTGGTVMTNPKNLWEIAYELGKNVKRMIILHDQGDFPDHPNVHFLPGIVPHHKLYPLCSLIINHGGLGTIGKCLWSDVPQISIPQMTENELCANLMSDMMTAVNPKEVTYDILADLIKDPKYNTDLAKERGDFIRQNNGVEMIINILREYKYLNE